MKQNLTEYNTISTNALKLCAIIAMVCDHLPYLLENWHILYYSFPWVLMHAAGRLTAPIFFYLLALGYRRTRNANSYTLRLIIFAFLSYIPYIWYFKGGLPSPSNFLELNVIFTMLFGLLLLRVAHEIRNMPRKIILAALCLIGGYWCDYSLYGLAMIVVCDIARENRRSVILGMGAVMMVYVYMRTSNWFPSDVSPFTSLLTLFKTEWMVGSLIVLLSLIIPLVLISRHRIWAVGAPEEARPGLLAKWGFYIFYPAHITALLLIKSFFL